MTSEPPTVLNGSEVAKSTFDCEQWIRDHVPISGDFIPGNTPLRVGFLNIRKHDLGSLAMFPIGFDTALMISQDPFTKSFSSDMRSFIKYLLNRQPWEQYDWYVFDPKSDWCIAVTHDDDLVCYNINLSP